MRRMIVALCSVALLIAVAAPAASATLPQRVTITSVMTYAEGGHSYGTFEATGPAVTRHLICPNGQVRDIYLNEVEGGWDVVKAFVCADGSQSFIVRLQVKVNENGGDVHLGRQGRDRPVPRPLRHRLRHIHALGLGERRAPDQHLHGHHGRRVTARAGTSLRRLAEGSPRSRTPHRASTTRRAGGRPVVHAVSADGHSTRRCHPDRAPRA